MIAVIQCAARKRPDAGHLCTPAGKRVTFVARPSDAPGNNQIIYARPDDPSGQGSSWRELLLQYNKDPTRNPLRLLPAWQLYENRAYSRLVESLGVENVFILSAGWGLIRADFRTPYYDVTFSPSADAYKRRRHEDQFSDLRMISSAANDELLFFGGKDYLPPVLQADGRVGWQEDGVLQLKSRSRGVRLRAGAIPDVDENKLAL